MMDPEEAELQNDYRYRSYSAIIEKALRNFESSSEWADLISCLGKLNKALQSNLKYSLLPRRLIIGKRLAQCLHPALPSGVHLKALETYEIIFKIIGTKWLARDLFIYSSGLFPLLSHAAMSVKIAVLSLYERYFLPLQRALLPSLQAFIIGLLPGLEEGLEVYDRTDALLLKLSLFVGQSVFYGALWGSALVCPLVRLPASLFIVTHFDRMTDSREQKHMLGNDHRLAVKAACLSLQDCNVLVQRNMLEILLFFFPFATCLDPLLCSVPLKREEMITVVSAASLTLLRRDMSLNRRLYAWFLGLDIKGGMVAPDTTLYTTVEEQHYCVYYFNTHSRKLLVQALVNILQQKDIEKDTDNVMNYLRPFRIIISLMDKSKIGPLIISDILLEVIRAFYSYCRELLGEELLTSSHSGNQLISDLSDQKKNWSPSLSVTELSTVIIFLLDVIPLELYAEIQTQYLPQMLDSMLQSLSAYMASLSLADLTHTLRACFKVLSKIQMPVSYMGMDVEYQRHDIKETKAAMTDIKNFGTDNQDKDDRIQEDKLAVNENDAQEVGPEVAMFQSLCSEDSGLGLSASSSEQQLPADSFSSKAEDVWRKGGGMENMSKCIQDILASIIKRYLLVVVDPKKQNEEEKNQASKRASRHNRTPFSSARDGSRDLGLIKDKLTEIFIPSKLREQFPEAFINENGKSPRPAHLQWTEGFRPRIKGEISESCRHAFTAACHLLLESTTFPVYYTEKESQELYSKMFENTTECDEGCSLPEWLRSLMMLCCITKDYQVQHVAISSLLELINHSQSLALVIQDKNQRYKRSEASPFSGQLKMVTLPPIYPAVLKTMELHADFYQRAAQVLWAQLDTERKEKHISCVELFYRLHCLAPSTAICEDIICMALLNRDKVVRLEAFYRFSVLWHLMREVQMNRSTSLNRSFDRSLFVVLDSLNSQDGSISAVGQSWLVRALSLGDVVRILEPVLLLLLDPKTQRTSVQNVKHNLLIGNWNTSCYRDKNSIKNTGGGIINKPENSILTHTAIVDREAIWLDLQRDPEFPEIPSDSPVMSRSDSEETDGDDNEESEDERTESADTSGSQNSTEASSSGSTFYLQPPANGEGIVVNGLKRGDSECTQASDSLSSDEDDGQLKALAKSRLIKQQRERQEAVDSLFQHIFLYKQIYESERILYAFAVVETMLRSNAGPFVEALSNTALDCSSTAHLNLIQNLLQRHRQAQEGGSFYGPLQNVTPSKAGTPEQTPPSPPSSPSTFLSPSTLLLEMLTCICLSFLRSYFPSHANVNACHVQANQEVQVKSVEVLTALVEQLVTVARQSQTGETGANRTLEAIRNLLLDSKLQHYVLLTLSNSMYVCQRADAPVYHLLTKGEQRNDVEVSEERLVHCGRDEHPIQIALLKLLKVLIVLEHCVFPTTSNKLAQDILFQQPQEDIPSSTLAREWHSAIMFQQSIKAVRYVARQPITAQGMFVSAAARALRPQYGFAMHPAWVTLLCQILPFLGRSLAIIVAPIITQICRNLDEFVKQHEHNGFKATHGKNLKKENIAPDYPLTLLEGLTTITHYCLLEHKKSAGCDVTDMRNACNAILEDFPHIVSTMGLLWGVVKGADSHYSSKSSSTSVYFKSTKILKQKILGLLIPLTQQYGVQVMASVAAVCNSRWSRKRHSKNRILPVASDSQMTIVDLVKSVNTLRIETILQLIREVVKKPHQIKGDQQKPALVDVPMLQFCFFFIQSLSAHDLQENIMAILSLLKDSVQLNLAPPGHFLLLGILNDFVNRLPSMDNKRDSRELQEVTQRILEAVGAVAGSSLEQTSWLSRNLEVKAQPQVCLQENEDKPEGSEFHESADQGSAMVSSSAPSVFSVQALVLLAEIIAPLLDMVYRSDEKEKALPLISRLMYYVFPYLKNHSAYNMPSFTAGAQLLSSLSGYAYTKRAWKKEVLELFMDPLFFTLEMSCVCHWKSITDHLLTHEKTMFKDLMSMQSSSLKLFNSVEQKPMLLKRQAFAMFSGETDQYHLYLPLIQERLTENLRMGQTPAVSAQMFLMFRVLLLRISPQHLTSLWPIMVTELIRVFARLKKALLEDKDVSKNKQGSQEKNSLKSFPGTELDMYLSACKFLDTAVSFPPERMPLFQMYRWAFVPEVDVDSYEGSGTTLLEGEQECKPHVVRILESLRHRYGELNGRVKKSESECLEFPLLTLSSLSSITQLMPFFQTLCCSFCRSTLSPYPPAEYPPSNADRVLQRLELITEQEFLDAPVSPRYLHTNSTSHTGPFSAIAELIDNAYDPDVSAKQFWIDKTLIKGQDCLIFMDNGKGMDYDKMHKMLSVAREYEECLHDILAHSLFNTRIELLSEFSAIDGPYDTSSTGTRIIIWNLRKTSSGFLEFDFTKDRYDIQLPVDVIESTKELNKEPESGKIAPDTEYSLQKRGIKITFGYNTKSKDHYGLMLYHKNRLIKAYEHAACQRKANKTGVGVVGVLECNHLTPMHNKQDFERTEEFRKTIQNVSTKLEEYWKEVHYRRQKIQKCSVPVEDDVKKPDQNWVQCDACSQWRKLPDGIDTELLPDKWFCYMNPDPQFRSCAVEEEPEDSDDEQPRYQKTYKQEQRRALNSIQENREMKRARRVHFFERGTPGNPSTSTALPKFCSSPNIINPDSFQASSNDNETLANAADDDILIIESIGPPRPKSTTETFDITKVKVECMLSEEELGRQMEHGETNMGLSMETTAEYLPPVSFRDACIGTQTEQNPFVKREEKDSKRRKNEKSSKDELLEFLKVVTKERDESQAQLRFVSSEVDKLRSQSVELAQSTVNKENNDNNRQTSPEEAQDYQVLYLQGKEEIMQLQEELRQLKIEKEEMKSKGQEALLKYDNDLSCQVDLLLGQIDQANTARDELINKVDSLEKKIEKIKQESEKLKLRAKDQGVQTDFSICSHEQSATTSAKAFTSGSGTDFGTQQHETHQMYVFRVVKNDIKYLLFAIKTEALALTHNNLLFMHRLRELRQKVARLLVTFVPALDLQQVNFECSVIDEILTQTVNEISLAENAST
ncbi:Protein dopey-2 [Bagarius yarrelli]|uniref:Protein dopey-2 n=1 Tax=Bagarius yarrelli TaxID=175774 RepID=A0A556V4P5_BAGYA|nr:Protein dopey-2 [Bagarius yarrelli]